MSDQKLPAWVCELSAIPHGSTLSELSLEVKAGSIGDLKALQHFLQTLLSRRMREPLLQKKLCLPFTEATLKKNVIQQSDLSNRTKNCLLNYVSKRDGQIVVNELTFGDLMRMRSMGAKSIIEFLMYMESSLPEHDTSPSSIDKTLEALQTKLANLAFEMRWQSWAREIISGDNRFPELTRPLGNIHLDRGDPLEVYLDGISDYYLNFPQGLVETAIRILESIKERVAQLESLPLDDVLKDFIKAHYKKGKQENLEAMYARFGLTRKGILTLEESGQIAGITRERIRQIEKKILDSVVRGDFSTFMPKLDKALALMNDSIGLDVLSFSDKLIDAGICKSPISADAVLYFAKLCNRESARAEVVRVKDGTRVISSSEFEFDRISRILRKLFSRNGIADLQLAALHFDIDEDEFITTAKNYLSQGKSWIALDSEKRWWIPNEDISNIRNRLVNVTRKILSVSNPISVGDVREGYQRLAKYRNSSSRSYTGDWTIVVPSKSAILLFFDYVDGFHVSGEMISTDELIDYREALGNVEKTIVDVVLKSPSGVLRRSDIQRECAKRGINQNSLMLYTTFSPVVQHIAQETFKLTGKQVTASALSAHQEALSKKIKRKAVLVADWKEGRIRLCVRCHEQTPSMVVGSPATFKPLLKKISLEAYDQHGNRVGTIASNDNGDLWGMGSFCSKNGLEENDILTMELDVPAGKAYLYQSVLSEILDDIE